MFFFTFLRSENCFPLSPWLALKNVQWKTAVTSCWFSGCDVAARAGGLKAGAAVINLTDWLECQRQFLSSPFSNTFDRLFITWLREINSYQGSGKNPSGAPDYKRGNTSLNSICFWHSRLKQQLYNYVWERVRRKKNTWRSPGHMNSDAFWPINVLLSHYANMFWLTVAGQARLWMQRQTSHQK